MGKKITYELELKYKEAVANLDEMQKAYAKLETQNEKLTEQIEKQTEATKDTTAATKEFGSIADKLTGGAITKFKSLTSTLGSVTTGFKTMRGAIISTGIGALVVAVGSLAAAFTSSEEGQNKFSKALMQVKVVIGNVIDVAAELGRSILNLGGAITKFFSGDFKGAVAEGSKAFEGFTNKLKNFGEETKKEIAIAKQLADQIASADKLERKLTIDRAKAQRDAAELKAKSADREKFTAEERIKFLEQASAIESNILKEEERVAEMRLKIKQEQNKLSDSTKADLDEEAQLEANLITLRANSAMKQRELTAQIFAFKQELKAAKGVGDDNGGVPYAEESRIAFEEYIDYEQELLDEEVEKSLVRNNKLVEIEREKQAMLRAARDGGLAHLQSVVGAETAVGRAAALARAAIAAKEMIGEIKKTISFSTLAASRSAVAVAEGTAQTAKVGFPQNIPLLISYAAQAVGIIGAMKQAVSKSKGSSAGLEAPRGVSNQAAITGQMIAPSFNIVGSSGASQLADAIGQKNQQPIKAYVVSSDVSTAQSLDRNIIQGAKI